MDAVSFSKAAQQENRIKKVIAEPDSTSGLVTMPSTIATGETITIPAGRTVVHPNLQVDGILDVQGTLFIPSGGSVSTTEVDATVVKQNGNVVANDSAVIHNTGNETKAGVLTLTDGLKLQGQNVSPFSGFKNYIINGNFDVWQRGTSQTSIGYGSVDRWQPVSIGSTFNFSRTSSTYDAGALGMLANAQYSCKMVVTSVAGGSNQSFFLQPIEDISKLSSKTVTMSFWAKADSNKNIAVLLSQFFGTGGSPSSPVYSNVNYVNLTSAWQKFSFVMTVPSISGKTIGTDGFHTTYTAVRFQFEAGATVNSSLGTASLIQQSGTFEIAQVQLEEGSVATPFENRPIGLELSLCQRYYVGIYASIGAAANSTYLYGGTVSFPVTMRTTPTIQSSVYSASVAPFGTVGTFGVTPSCASFYNASSNWQTGVSVVLSAMFLAEL